MKRKKPITFGHHGEYVSVEVTVSHPDKVDEYYARGLRTAIAELQRLADSLLPKPHGDIVRVPRTKRQYHRAP